MPRMEEEEESGPAVKGALNGTLGKTLYSTAKSAYNLGAHAGTGTTLEVTCYEREPVHVVSFSGYKEAVFSLNLPQDFYAEQRVVQRGGGYVTVNLSGDTYISRWQLNDLLMGQGWKLIGYSTGNTSQEQEVVRELWAASSKSSRSKKREK